MNVMLQKSSTLELGYLVYEKIGNDAKAEELASFQLKFTRFPFPKSNAHRALGRILQRRGEGDAAAAHFDKASEAAHLCRCPFLALIAGKDMGGEPGEAIIATACEKMGKWENALTVLDMMHGRSVRTEEERTERNEPRPYSW